MNSNEINRGGTDYVGYDYKTVIAEIEKASMVLDAYRNFGWAQDESIPAKQFAGAVKIKLKRDRKIINKAELTRLQQHFDACVDEIFSLENSKEKKATVYSLVAGLISTAFLAASVFAVTNEPPMILLCVLFGVPGLIGWGLAYPVYKLIVKKRAAEVIPLIDRKYEEIHEICEKGNSLIH